MSGYTTNQIPIITIQGSWPTNQLLKGKDGDASYIGVNQLQDILADFVQKTAQAMTAYNGTGLAAQLPPAGQYGRQYYAVDSGTLYEDVGTAWIPIAGSGPYYFVIESTNFMVGPPVNLYIIEANVTATLPAATGSGFAPVFKPVNNGFTVVIDPAGSDTIDGSGVKTSTSAIQLIDYGVGTWAIL